MPAVFFGATDRQLYGVYHPPLARPVRPAGVLICPGFGHEYMRSHRAFVRMAEQLALKGYPVFRYDHEGTGDSAGEMDELDLARLEDGVSVAAEELLAMSEAPRVAIIGHRLGGWLALRAAAQLPCRAVVLCDPVLDGREYVRLLRSEGAPRSGGHGVSWVHGYPWPEALLNAIDIQVRETAHESGVQVAPFGGDSRLDAVDLLRQGPLVVPGGGVAQIAEFLEQAA
jgi:alpha-beta hydrolase superfamily lysophospholipase